MDNTKKIIAIILILAPLSNLLMTNQQKNIRELNIVDSARFEKIIFIIEHLEDTTCLMYGDIMRIDYWNLEKLPLNVRKKVKVDFSITNEKYMIKSYLDNNHYYGCFRWRDLPYLFVVSQSETIPFGMFSFSGNEINIENYISHNTDEAIEGASNVCFILVTEHNDSLYFNNFHD